MNESTGGEKPLNKEYVGRMKKTTQEDSLGSREETGRKTDTSCQTSRRRQEIIKERQQLQR